MVDTDPIASMLIKIKNGSLANHEMISLPYSNIKHQIGNCLMKEGFVKSVIKKMKDKGFNLEIGLIYNEGTPRVSGVKRVSKPSQRLYAGMKDIKLVKSGKGIMILSTPKGVMSGREARKEMVGGEIICQIW